ncbi:hypothetical protein LTR27_005594 [Elasticomyces elasticus]|nr:hypothetical protein LTR27_005594 [Elasticomyces elasticus]
MHPDWVSQSRQTLLHSVQSHVTGNKNMTYKIRDHSVIADVSDCKRKATVWLLVDLGGMVIEEEQDRLVVREWVLRMSWRRRIVDGAAGSIGSRWICERVVPMSAAGGFIGNL